MVAITTISCMVHAENGALMDRKNTLAPRYNDHHSSAMDGEPFLQNVDNGHLIVKQSLKMDNRNFFGFIIIPCKCYYIF